MAGRGEEHSLQLDEDEELQLALAISAAEASGGTTNASEDERLARQLQVRLDPASMGASLCRHRCRGRRKVLLYLAPARI
jgi:hypothetical protein